MSRSVIRYWEIDAVRGVAVLFMIIYHFIFDLFYFSYYRFYWLALLTASTFILVSGISLSISYSRGGDFKRFAKRGIKLLVFAGVVTASTVLFLDKGHIWFGILHFFSVSSFLIYPILKYLNNQITLLIGILLIMIGVFFLNTTVSSNNLIWLGLTTPDFFTLDFFPLLPWFGLLLIGTYVGNRAYPKGKRGFAINDIDNPITKTLRFFGKNSLLIYFIHQPIIILLLSAFWKAEVLSLINI